MLEAHPKTSLALADALASFLRRLHAIRASACPFNSDHAYRLALASKRIDAGVVEVDNSDDKRRGWTAEQVRKAMQALLPLSLDPVVTHGDFSLGNIIIQGGEVVGCIDVERAGIADRYQDLAIAWNRLGAFGLSLQARFLEQHGVADADQRKLQSHLLLDELF